MKLYYFSGACSLASNISVLSWGRFVNIDLGVMEALRSEGLLK